MISTPWFPLQAEKRKRVEAQGDLQKPSCAITRPVASAQVRLAPRTLLFASSLPLGDAVVVLDAALLVTHMLKCFLEMQGKADLDYLTSRSLKIWLVSLFWNASSPKAGGLCGVLFLPTPPL